MIITTSARTNDEMIGKAKQIAFDLNALYVPRNKKSVKSFQEKYEMDCIVVGKDRLEWFSFGEEAPFFFHPNSSSFRMKRILRGERDPFLDVCELQTGMDFLDCTLGLGSDSIIASHAVGSTGKVVAIEGNPSLALVVKEGLSRWDTNLQEMNKAMRQIEVIHSFYEEYLLTLPAASFDVVYFDPMFEETIESEGMQALKKVAVYHDLTEKVLEEARRVARRRIVLKDHYLSSRFTRFGFNVLKRSTSKFHFGYINI